MPRTAPGSIPTSRPRARARRPGRASPSRHPARGSRRRARPSHPRRHGELGRGHQRGHGAANLPHAVDVELLGPCLGTDAGRDRTRPAPPPRRETVAASCGAGRSRPVTTWDSRRRGRRRGRRRASAGGGSGPAPTRPAAAARTPRPGPGRPTRASAKYGDPHGDRRRRPGRRAPPPSAPPPRVWTMTSNSSTVVHLLEHPHDERGRDVVGQVGHQATTALPAARPGARPVELQRVALHHLDPDRLDHLAQDGTRWRSDLDRHHSRTGLGQGQGQESRVRRRSRGRVEPARTPASRAMRRTVLGSATKFCPRARFGRRPCAARSSAMSAPERVTRRL